MPTFSIAVSSAEVSGAISNSRFLMRWSAARRAERGPKPGSRASNWIRRSISGPATAVGMRAGAPLKRFQAWRQREAAGQVFHLFLQQRFGLAPRVGMCGDQQVFNDFFLARLDQGIVDLDAFHVTLRSELHADQPASGGALDLDLVELRLQRLHFRFQLRRLLHHAHEIGHYSSSRDRAAGVSGLLTETISAPGKR